MSYAVQASYVTADGKASTLAAARGAALGANGRQIGGLQRRATWRIEPILYSLTPSCLWRIERTLHGYPVIWFYLIFNIVFV